MTEDGFTWLQQWFASHCDGDWEHSDGIRIGTLDNPGWELAVDLRDTELANRPFTNVKLDRSEVDWVQARVQDGRFEAFGGPKNLTELLSIFRNWAEAQ